MYFCFFIPSYNSRHYNLTTLECFWVKYFIIQQNQYKFLYYALSESFQTGSHVLSKKSFFQEVDSQKQLDKDAGLPNFRKEYNVLFQKYYNIVLFIKKTTVKTVNFKLTILQTIWTLFYVFRSIRFVVFTWFFFIFQTGSRIIEKNVWWKWKTDCNSKFSSKYE